MKSKKFSKKKQSNLKSESSNSSSTYKVKIQDLDILSTLEKLSHFLPSQGPIKNFIHHNTLHSFQEHGLSFHEAIRSASWLYGSREYLPLSYYRELYVKGEISEWALKEVLKQVKDQEIFIRAKMLQGNYPDELRRSGFRGQGYFHSITTIANIKVEEHIHPIIFRLFANFLDQGVAFLHIPGQLETQDFWSAFREQLKVASPVEISSNVTQLILRFEPEELIEYSLQEILPSEADKATFLLELLMAARGWSGLISQLEKNPQLLNLPRKVSLAQYVALYLALLLDLLKKTNYKPELLLLENRNTEFLQNILPEETEAEKIFRLWHEALEMSYYLEVLQVLELNAKKVRKRSSAEGRARFQAIFCIDDRECSIRRYLEELSEEIETFGTPGFFGIDAVYRGPEDAISIKQCPAPMTPNYLLEGIASAKKNSTLLNKEMKTWYQYANGLFLGWFISLFLGAFALVRLIFSVLKPSQTLGMADAFSTCNNIQGLHYMRQDNTSCEDGYLKGYTIPEMADRVEKVLRQIGLTHSFAPIVAVVGHGSSSTNNPYFAAYDCGACSGRPGGVNAYTFALMANLPEVRKILAKNGVVIPETTLFVGALRDTARDEILFLNHSDKEKNPEWELQIKKLEEIFRQALELNALERSRRFDFTPFVKTSKEAVKEVRLRTEMLFEPRPEYNHATNALAIIGRRSLTENLFLDRRAFLNSYDPLQDKDGSILLSILTPLLPVCGGINLEYLFSRLDNTIYGAGSKLPHNVFSLVGVGNGSESDLRTGLPEQMIEIHDPIRLLVIIEQKSEIVQSLLEKNPHISNWIEGEWVYLVVYDLDHKKFHKWHLGAFHPIKLQHMKKVEVFHSSQMVYKYKRGNVSPAIIQKGIHNDV